MAVICTVTMLGSVGATEAKKLRIQWSTDVDQRLPNAPMALSTPALLNHNNQTLIVLGGRDAWVHVYDLKGSEVRRFPLDAASDSGALSLHNGLVVLGDIAGRLYGVDPVQGKIVWRVQLSASFTGTPVAIGQDFLVQTTDNRIYRFSPGGEKRWSFSGQNSALSLYLNPSPLVVGERIYVLLSNGDAIALKAYSGDLLWKRQLLLSNEMSVLTDLKAPLATPLFLPSLNIDGERAINALLMPFFQGDMIALSAKDGGQNLSLPISLKSAPLVIGSMLYAADSSGFLHAYNIKKGNRVWSKKISIHELLGPVSWKNQLWLTDNKGMVYHLNLNGEVQSKTNLKEHVSRLPVVTKAGLLVRTNRGSMYLVHP